MSELSPAEVLHRLRDGNRRFVRSLGAGRTSLEHFGHLEVSPEHQDPVAVVLACSDSRVPVELVFDQGVGDLFVIRVIGNVVGGTQLASAGFASTVLGTSLVVVLGHTGCGAVRATLDAMAGRPAEGVPHLDEVIALIRPAVEGLPGVPAAGRGPGAGAWEPDGELLRRAERANVRHSVESLRRRIAGATAREDGQRIACVGGMLSLETGRVDFFPGVPEAERPEPA